MTEFFKLQNKLNQAFHKVLNEIGIETEGFFFKINKGSMGQFDISCRASVKSTLLMADFIKNFKALEKWSCIFCNKVESFNNLKN